MILLGIGEGFDGPLEGPEIETKPSIWTRYTFSITRSCSLFTEVELQERLQRVALSSGCLALIGYQATHTLTGALVCGGALPLMATTAHVFLACLCSCMPEFVPGIF